MLQPPCVRPLELRAEKAACSGGRRASSDLQLLGFLFFSFFSFFFSFFGTAGARQPWINAPLLRPAHSFLASYGFLAETLKGLGKGAGPRVREWDPGSPRAQWATMTDESSDVPRELMGKPGAVAD